MNNPIKSVMAFVKSINEARNQPGWVAPFVEWAHGKQDELNFHGAWVPPRLQELVRAGYPEVAIAQDRLNAESEFQKGEEPEDSK